MKVIELIKLLQEYGINHHWEEFEGTHSGIENSIFAEFKGCNSDNINLLNKEQILNSFDEIMPNCKDVKFRILGFSLATINMFISLIIIIISVFLIKNYENK